MGRIGDISGVNVFNVKKLDEVVAANIKNVSDVDFIIGTFVKKLFFYDFEGETPATGGFWENTSGYPNSLGDTTIPYSTEKWIPSSAMSGSLGTDCVNYIGSNLGNQRTWRNHGTPQNLVIPLGQPTHTSSLNVSGSREPWNQINTGGTSFDGDSGGNAVITGWNLEKNKDTFSAGTGPDGGAASPYINGNQPNPNSGSITADQGAYLYAETSPGNGAPNKIFICSFCIYGLSQLMTDTNNDLYLKFMTHAKGTTLGNLKIYRQSSNVFHTVEDAGTFELAGVTYNAKSEIFPIADKVRIDNETYSAQIDSLTKNELRNLHGISPSFDHSTYIENTYDINVLKNLEINVDSTLKYHWIYFVYGNAIGFKGDLAIDNVRIEEHRPTL